MVIMNADSRSFIYFPTFPNLPLLVIVSQTFRQPMSPEKPLPSACGIRRKKIYEDPMERWKPISNISEIHMIRRSSLQLPLIGGHLWFAPNVCSDPRHFVLTITALEAKIDSRADDYKPRIKRARWVFSQTKGSYQSTKNLQRWTRMIYNCWSIHTTSD